MTSTQPNGLSQARREIVTASALWREGLVPEAQAAMASALRLALQPWTESETDEVQEDPSANRMAQETSACAALERAGYRNVDRLRAALAETANGVAAQGNGDFEWIWAEAERLTRFGTRRLVTPAERKRARQWRAVMGALAGALILIVAGRLWLRPHCSASGVYDADYPVSYAFDGMTSTEWLLPDRTPGWVQVSFAWSRHVRHVRVVNAHNKFWMDRAAQKIRVTAFSKGKPVATVEGNFPRLTDELSALDLPLDAKGVDQVRVDVLTFYGNGGALAEIEVH